MVRNRREYRVHRTDGPAAAPATPRSRSEMANPLRTLKEYGQSVWLDFRQPRSVEERRARPADRRGRAARRHLEPVDLREGDRPRRRLRRADRRRRSRPAISIPARCSRIWRSATSRKAPTRCARSTSRPRGATAISVSRSRPIWRCRPTRRSRRRAGCGARSAATT